MDSTTLAVVAILFNLVFWTVAVIFMVLLRRDRHPLCKYFGCGIAPGKGKIRTIAPQRVRTDSTRPLQDDYDSDSTIGDDSDEWEDEDQFGEPNLYMNTGTLSGTRSTEFQSFNSLRSENLQLDLFNKGFRTSTKSNRESGNYESMPDVPSPHWKPSVIYQSGQEIVRIERGRQGSQLPGVPSVAYENFDLPPPPTMPPPVAEGEIPLPPTVPPPPLTTQYENIPEDELARERLLSRATAKSQDVVPFDNLSDETIAKARENRISTGDGPLLYEDIEEYNKPEPPPQGARPPSLTYENPDLFSDKRESAVNPGMIAYEDPSEYDEDALKKAKAARESIAYEDLGEEGIPPPTYALADDPRESIAYEDFAEEELPSPTKAATLTGTKGEVRYALVNKPKRVSSTQESLDYEICADDQQPLVPPKLVEFPEGANDQDQPRYALVNKQRKTEKVNNKEEDRDGEEDLPPVRSRRDTMTANL